MGNRIHASDCIGDAYCCIYWEYVGVSETLSPKKYALRTDLGVVEIESGYEVIGGAAFQKSSITSIKLPDTLLRIEAMYVFFTDQ